MYLYPPLALNPPPRVSPRFGKSEDWMGDFLCALSDFCRSALSEEAGGGVMRACMDWNGMEWNGSGMPKSCVGCMNAKGASERDRGLILNLES